MTDRYQQIANYIESHGFTCRPAGSGWEIKIPWTARINGHRASGVDRVACHSFADVRRALGY